MLAQALQTLLNGNMAAISDVMHFPAIFPTTQDSCTSPQSKISLWQEWGTDSSKKWYSPVDHLLLLRKKVNFDWIDSNIKLNEVFITDWKVECMLSLPYLKAPSFFHPHQYSTRPFSSDANTKTIGLLRTLFGKRTLPSKHCRYRSHSPQNTLLKSFHPCWTHSFCNSYLRLNMSFHIADPEDYEWRLRSLPLLWQCDCCWDWQQYCWSLNNGHWSFQLVINFGCKL